ncbi:Dynein_light chain [Hexamita inflata]|nr:Dynein light chain [Hexamita inflata]CAI9972098.1 Dynein light chain [Hexamita inflata]
MPEDRLDKVKKILIDTFKIQNKSSGEYAVILKDLMDNKMGPTWHAIVGKSFGSDIMHESYQYLNCTYGQWSIIVFKAGYL